MIQLDLLVILCLFLILLLVLYISYPLLMYGCEPGYYISLVGILWWYQYMLVVYLCLCVCVLFILYHHGFLWCRNFHYVLGTIAIFHIHYIFQSMVLIVVVTCFLLYWVLDVGVNMFSILFQSIQLCGPGLS